MRVKLVSIGNSKGIHILSSFLKQCGIEDEIDIDMKGQRITIDPVKKRPRAGWNEAFSAMHAQNDDVPLMNGIADSFDTGWEWK